MKKWLISIAIIAFAFSGAFVMVQTRAAPTQMQREIPVLLVDAIEARREPVIFRINTQGAVTPRTESILVSEVSGQIVEVASNYVSGGFFRQGDLLLKIDPRNYQSALKSAQANVARVQTQVAKENALANFALDDWKTLQDLNASTGPISDLALRKPQLAEAYAQLEFAKADLEKRLGDLDRTVIRAPYDGLVREKLADLGQFVNAGSPVASTFSVDVAEIRLPLPDKELPFLDLNDTKLKQGRGPKVTFSALIGGRTHSWTGSIVRTEGVFDERSRVLYVVAQVDDPYNQQTSNWPHPLRIGTFVEARIEGERLENVIRLPRSVLRGDNRVWAVTAADTLQPVTVDVIRSDERSILVSSGLTDGQLICTTLLDNPLPGTPVRFGQSPSTRVGMNLGNN